MGGVATAALMMIGIVLFGERPIYHPLIYPGLFNGLQQNFGSLQNDLHG